MIPLLHKSGKLLYEQIYEYYKEAILHQQLKHHQRLPSYRALAKALGVANNTVLKAYEQLVLEGYVNNEKRKGLFVTSIERNDISIRQRSEASLPLRKVAKGGERVSFKTSVRLVDEKNFPIKQWRKCNNWAIDNISFQYQEHEDNDPLKEQLIKYLFNYRGVKATPERLLIGSGASVLVFWLAFLMRKTCSKIITEEPGYPRTRLLFSEFGYKVKPVRVSADGIDLKLLSKEKADLIYLTPSHQYPTGATVPVSNRIKILNWAKKNNAYVIEDDFDCEFRYKSGLIPSLQGLDESDRVIYVGSFSSALMPSLRVAYLILPEHFPLPYQSFSFLTNTVPYFTRKALAHFMEGGFWERHLKKMRKIYKQKYDTCIEALKKIPKNRIQFNHVPSGLNILLRINTRLTEEALIKRAQESGILITPASEFYAEKPQRSNQPEVLFEFGSVPQDEIEKVVEKLHASWFKIT